MKIVIDENITYGREAFSELGELKILPGREITNAILKDADALIVRSITNVNEELLSDTSIRFVGTATIGTDHIDKKYLSSKNIAFADAKGCNSDAVAEYVFNALFNIANEKKFLLRNKSIGVVGVGNIGSKIVKYANALGMKVFMNDPPLERTGRSGFYSLQEVLSADILTFHVPLNKGGIDNTFHLLGKDELENIKEGTIIINASRGPVIDNSALLSCLEQKNLSVVLDVWEDEPNINIDLLCKVKYGTPHVAGYSFEGKVNGTTMMYNALCEYLDRDPEWSANIPLPENSFIGIDGNSDIETELRIAFNHTYRIADDDKRMREIINKDDRSGYFDKLRKNYPLRRELCNYTVSMNQRNESLRQILKTFRLKSF